MLADITPAAPPCRHCTVAGILASMKRTAAALWFGNLRVGPALLHPLALVFAASGSAMISGTLRVPKP